MTVSSELEAKIDSWLEEDIGFGDITTNAVIPQEVKSEAEIIAKAPGIIAGMQEATILFSRLGCRVKPLKRDGESVRKGEKILEIRGPASSILKGERVALNLLMRMSGIATLTRKFVDICRKIDPNVRISCTRKTAPGLRLLDKRAVQIGGGETHRLRLDDAILIKDNHLRIVGSVEEAVRRAKQHSSFTKKVEIEVTTLTAALNAAKAGADIIMLDNLSPKLIERIVQAVKSLKNRSKVMVEASGGINLQNVADYGRTGVDIISVGALTHSAPALDLSLEIVETGR